MRRELASQPGRINQHGLDERDIDMTGRKEPTTPTVATRRAILLGVGAIGAGGVLAGVLAACGSSSPSTTGSATVTKQPIKVADIPVGGGAIFADQDVVVTQPVAGQFKAFSATCTHQACLVASVAQGKIICPCH